jgi:signal transduction histidine kinase
MFSIRSSRAARIKALVIIGLLLFPVIYLSQAMLADIFKQRSNSSGRTEALKAAELMIPIVNASISGATVPTGAMEALAAQLAKPPLQVPFQPTGLTNGTAERKMTVALQMLQPIEVFAKLNSAGASADEEVSDELIGLALNDMPRFVLRLAALKDELSQTRTGRSLATMNVGEAIEAGRAVIERIDLARAISGDAEQLNDVRNRISVLVDGLQIVGSQNADGVKIAEMMTKAGAAWQLAHDELERAQTAQEGGVMQNRLGKVGFAFFMSLFGLAGAMLFFGKTLQTLDETKVSHDVADQARIEAEAMNARLSDINDDVVRLNRELADKMTRLKQAQDELLKRGRLEQLGQLTATVAHELRNPLGAVRTSAFLLERKIKDKGLGVEPQLQRIANGILRCDSIITQLLDFSRTKQIDAAPGDFDGWLEALIEEEARKLPSSVEIHCTLGLEGQPVRFDKARMQRAVINLMMNASEALVGTGDDPAKFAVRNPRIAIGTSIEDGMACLSVSDNGPGISPELISKVREPLFTTKSFGTGLGIPAVDQIAVQHGGRLDIASEHGQGASFKILLPLGATEAKAA